MGTEKSQKIKDNKKAKSLRLEHTLRSGLNHFGLQGRAAVGTKELYGVVVPKGKRSRVCDPRDQRGDTVIKNN